jgi:hypothetical protein
MPEVRRGVPQHGWRLNAARRGFSVCRSEPDTNPIKPMENNMHPYRRFAAMIAASTLLMFGLMYLNTYEADHVFFSQTRAWMALLMGAAMALTMLAFMTHMLPKRGANLGIAAGSAIVFAMSLWLVRSQVTVDDVSYMKAMIPHHSIAIMTSRRAKIADPRVRKLADGIIEAQVREIAEMKQLIQELKDRAR